MNLTLNHHTTEFIAHIVCITNIKIYLWHYCCMALYVTWLLHIFPPCCIDFITQTAHLSKSQISRTKKKNYIEIKRSIWVQRWRHLSRYKTGSCSRSAGRRAFRTLVFSSPVFGSSSSASSRAASRSCQRSGCYERSYGRYLSRLIADAHLKRGELNA